MKFLNLKFFCLILLSLVISNNGLLIAQTLVNKGAQISIKPGAFLFVGGDLQNENQGANNGVITVEGTVSINGNGSSMLGSIDNGVDAELNLSPASLFQLTGNFSNSGFFNANVSSTVEFNGDIQQEYNNFPSATTWKFGNIHINTQGLNLNNDLFVKPGGGITFYSNQVLNSPHNVIHTGDNYLIMETDNIFSSSFNGINTGIGSTSPFDSNYVHGSIRWLVSANKAVYDFPVGDPVSLQYMNLQFIDGTVLENSGIKVLEASFDPSTPPNHPPECGTVSDLIPFTGSWNFHAWANTDGTGEVTNLLAGNEYTLVMCPRNISPSGTNYAIQIQHSDESSHSIVKLLNGDCYQPPSAPFELLVLGLDKFSKASGVETPEPLPISAFNFMLEPKNDQINIMWSQFDESYVKYYHIQKSTNGFDFITIKSDIQVKNNSVINNNYQVYDKDVRYNQWYYYRIITENVNGELNYSNIKKARIQNELQSNIICYPNPFKDQLTLFLNDYSETNGLSIRLYNLLGEELYNDFITPDDQLINIHSEAFSLLSSGTYILHVTSENINIQFKLIKN